MGDRILPPRPGRVKQMLAWMLLAAMFVFCLPVLGASAQVRRVRVGYFSMEGFQEKNRMTGAYRGYGYEYLLAVAQYAGWEYDFVQVDYPSGVEMLENGELDLMYLLDDASLYADAVDCSAYPAGESSVRLVTNKDNTENAYGDVASFGNLRVGMAKTETSYNAAFEAYCQENSWAPQLVWYDTQGQAAEAMQAGQVDARLMSSARAADVRELARFDSQPFYLAVTKGNAALLNELNDAMQRIQMDTPAFTTELWRRYYADDAGQRIVFSQREKEYLATKPVVRVGCSRSWYPLSYFDENGNYAGALCDTYGLISAQTGIQFEFVPYDYYYLAVDAFEKGKVDMVCEMPFDFSYAAERDAQITKPVATINVVRVESTGYAGSKSDDTYYHVATLRNTYLNQLAVEKNGTSVQYVPFADAKSCVEAVLDGQADYTYINSYQAIYYQAHARYLRLGYVPMPEMEYQLSFAVSKSADSCLLQILNKSIDGIGENRMNRIFRGAADAASSENVDIETLIYDNPGIFGGILALLAAALVTMCLSLVYSRRIRRKNAELEIATKAKTDFLARMSHDIRTPLNGIIGMTLLAQEEENSPRTREYLKKIDASGKYLQGLVNDILDMNRLTRDEVVLRPEPYDASEFEAYIEAVIRPLCDAKQQEFFLEPNPCPKALMVDKIRYNQMFVNLLSNAVKYTPVGGRIALRFENMETTEKSFTADYIVEDNGIGISPEFQKHMFEPFTQEKESVASTGSGLGLAIVKQIADKMNGTLTVASTPGGGTTIRLHVSLPFAPEKAEEKREICRGEERCLNGLHILLCEDNALNREIAQRLLEKAGAEVDAADNGAEALRMFSVSAPGSYDAILMDIRMPVMDGIQATRQIRRLARTDAQLPILAMTANGREEDRRNTRRAGMNEHLEKPIDPQRMYAALIQCVQEYQAKTRC